MALSMVTVTGHLQDASRSPLAGTITFAPVAVLSGQTVPVTVTDQADHLVIGPAGVPAYLSTGSFSVTLAATDNGALAPSGWAYQVTLQLAGQPPYSFTALIPSSPSPVDLSQLVPAVLAEALYSYLATAGGTMTGLLVLGGGLRIPGGAADGDVLTSDGAGNATWETASAGGGGAPSGSASGDLGGTYPGPQVTATHLSAPLPVAQGGTAAASAGAALTSLGAAAASALASEITRAEAAEGTNAAAIAAEAGRAEVAEALLATSSALTTETSRAEAAEGALLPLAGGTMSGPIAMGGSKVTGLANGSGAQDAAAFGQIAAAVATETSRAETAEALLATASALTTEVTRAEAAEALALPLAGGTMSGAIAMGAHKVTGLADGSAAQDAAAFHQIPSSLPPSGSAGGDLGSTYPNPQVTGTHLASPLPIAQGGTAAGTQQGALNALTGAQSAGKVVRSDGTNAALAAIQAGDVPTLNQNTTGTAANVTGTVVLANGGTGQTSAQAAMNALAGALTSGQFLRGNGTNVVMGAIQAADVPTLNQNTTGTAAGLSATLAIASGGTGQTGQQAAVDALAGAQTSGSYLRGNGTHVAMSAIQAADVPTLNQNTTGTAANVTGTVAVANGGTGAVTTAAARTALGLGNSATTSFDTTATDIKALGTQSAGSSGLPPNSDHVHPLTGLVTSVTAGDTSIVVGGTSAAPTLETATLDVIAADHPPVAAVGLNSQRLTSLATPAASTDAATMAYVDAETTRATAAESNAKMLSLAYAQSGGLAGCGYAGAMANFYTPTAQLSPTTQWTSGGLYGQLLFVVPGVSVNGFVTIVPWKSGSLANTFLALFNSAGTRLGITADLSAQASNGRGIRVAVTGFTATPADGIIYAVYTNGTSASAGPYPFSGQSNSFGAPIPPVTTVKPMGVYLLGTNTMPSSLTISSGLPSGWSDASPVFWQMLLD